MGPLGRWVWSKFGYDSAEDKSHRRRVSTVIQSEDNELPSAKRQKLIGQTHDIRRNFEVAAWAVRRHLDFVSTFRFRSTTAVPEWNRECERFVRDSWSTASGFDVAGRHSLRKAIRIGEALRAVAGDCGFLKVNDGRSQLVEGDRIRNPLQFGRTDGGRWCHGVKLNDAGAALAYAVHKRNGTGYVFERTVPSSRLYLHAHLDRYDQVRGISPLASAVNRLRDTYENIDYALAKSKVVNLFGLALYRKEEVEDDEDYEDEDDADPDDEFKLEVGKGPFTLNLKKDERAEFLQANHPAAGFTDFTSVCISIALKALDIPYCFFDESHGNYSANKSALSLYLMSCADKRADNRDLLNHLTRWRLGLAVATGELDPSRYGLTFGDLTWRWIARGVPWWDKGREVTGDLAAVHGGFQTWGDIIEERTDEDFFDVVDRRASEEAYLREKGVTIAGPQIVLNLSTAPPARKNDGEDEG